MYVMHPRTNNNGLRTIIVRLNKTRNVCRIMLPIGIHIYCGIVFFINSFLEKYFQCISFSKIFFDQYNIGACFSGDIRCIIR